MGVASEVLSVQLIKVLTRFWVGVTEDRVNCLVREGRQLMWRSARVVRVLELKRMPCHGNCPTADHLHDGPPATRSKVM